MLATDPVNPAIVYAATPNAGVFKSVDGGATWAPSNAGMERAEIVALAVDPTQPSTLYAGTFSTDAENIDHPLYKSVDSGRTWTPIDYGNLGSVATAIALSRSQPGRIYAASGSAPLVSTDAGAHWRRTWPFNLDSTAVSLAVDPANPLVVYAAVGQPGVAKTVDRGTTWRTVRSGAGDVLSVVIDPTNPSTVYAGGEYGVEKSTDGGTTWTRYTADGLYGRMKLALAPSRPQTLYAAVLDYGKVLRSDDAGVTWTERSVGLPTPAFSSVAVDPTTPDTVYLGTYGHGVYKSTDGGATWAASSTGLRTHTVRALAQDTAGMLYAGTSVNGVFTRSGDVWSESVDDFTVNALVATPGAAPTLYAGTDGSGVLKRAPGGDWVAAGAWFTAVDSPYISALECVMHFLRHTV